MTDLKDKIRYLILNHVAFELERNNGIYTSDVQGWVTDEILKAVYEDIKKNTLGLYSDDLYFNDGKRFPKFNNYEEAFEYSKKNNISEESFINFWKDYGISTINKYFNKWFKEQGIDNE